MQSKGRVSFFASVENICFGCKIYQIWAKLKQREKIMREMILKAVANPPKILWGPFVPVLMNLGIQFPLMFMAIGLGEINPLFFLISVLVIHIIIVAFGIKEPHMSNMLQAYGQTYRQTKNLYKVKGMKFAP